MSVADSQQVLPSVPSFDGIFPLPLTTLEYFMLLDATPAYTMMCDLEVHFDGQIDRGAFQSALAFAVARNPLFVSRIERQRDGTLAWVPTGELPPLRWFDDRTPLDDTYGAYTDLHTEPGLRVYVRQGAERAKVLLNFHHSCSDALGGFGFIEDLLAAYATLVGDGPPVEPRSLEPQRLLNRGMIGTDGRPLLRRLADVVIGAKEGIKFFAQSPRPLPPAERVANSPAEPTRPSYTLAILSPETSQGLRRAAAQAGATTNDVLLRDQYLTLRAWREAHGGCSDRERLRILMPQNLRAKDDYSMPAANVMSFAFVTRQARWCHTPERLLESIREETEAVRRGLLSLYFLGGLGTIHAAGLLPRILTGNWCFATSIVTNMGDPARRFVARFPRKDDGLQVGNLIYRGVSGSPPLRPRTHAAFTISQFARSVAISYRWDEHRNTTVEARPLLEQYLAQLEKTAASV